MAYLSLKNETIRTLTIIIAVLFLVLTHVTIAKAENLASITSSLQNVDAYPTSLSKRLKYLTDHYQPINAPANLEQNRKIQPQQGVWVVLVPSETQENVQHLQVGAAPAQPDWVMDASRYPIYFD